MPETTVLIAEHEPRDIAQREQTLRAGGYRILHAPSGAEVLRLLAAEEVHILLVSVPLSDVDGTTLVAEIRKAHRNTPLQIILCAQVRAERDMQAALEAGADDFVKKPFDEAELSARTRAAVMRWERQATLLKEREFFRIAVAEEERLSSLVLDQNQNLKEAYEKIRKLNEELEKANRELEQIAAFDSLSGLLNRRSLFHRISIEIERSIRLDVPLAGLMIDIDHFKDVNDNHGHQCGDLVIREIGARLQGDLRKYDYAGRYGGEEFFVVLSNSTEQQAMSISERFRRHMEEATVTCSGESIRVTVSTGVARYRAGESQESWIERADRAMYQAKQAGRNRIVLD
jgi:two-component system cell cycle response regulator